MKVGPAFPGGARTHALRGIEAARIRVIIPHLPSEPAFREKRNLVEMWGNQIVCEGEEKLQHSISSALPTHQHVN